MSLARAHEGIREKSLATLPTKGYMYCIQRFQSLSASAHRSVPGPRRPWAAPGGAAGRHARGTPDYTNGFCSTRRECVIIDKSSSDNQS